jgi:hypothetical protein
MRVPENDFVIVEGLGVRKVGLLGVGELAGSEVLDVHLDGEGGSNPDRSKVLWVLEFGRGEPVLGSRQTHSRGVA